MPVIDYHIVIHATDGLTKPLEVLNTFVQLDNGAEWIDILNDTLRRLKARRHCPKCQTLLETKGCPRCL